MVERKYVVLQMIPHTLFIEWDFRHYSLDIFLLFMELFTSHFYCSLVVGTVHDTVH